MYFVKRLVALCCAVQFFSLTGCGEKSSADIHDVADSGKMDCSEFNDSLCGKVWFVIGDSFSMGDWFGSDSIPMIQDGLYKGNLPVYSYLIGNRTGMNVQNIAMNGSTLSYYDGAEAMYSFTHPQGRLFTTDFSKADYITIYYGINDSNLDIPVGSIDDSVVTTFYGAYNRTLEYLTRHAPKAKIGLIVSNSCASTDYPDATVKIAEKWGLPYLDLDGGVNCPTMLLCSSRNPATAEEKMSILEQQRISPTNNHPNELAHEIESTFIEEWLRSL